MSSTIGNIRDKIKRKLSMGDKNANIDEYDDPEDVDEETVGHMHKEIERAEADADKYPQGRPNSFLNRLISHGNKKTEDEIARDSQTNLADTVSSQPEGARTEGNAGGAPAGSTTSS